jgi:hypothetical protein
MSNVPLSNLHPGDFSGGGVSQPPPPAVEIIDPPAASMPKRSRGRLDDSLAAHREVKRSRGGQPGNRNALKHGLYLEGARIRNTTPLERAELFDIYHVINYIKDYMQHTFEAGINTKDLAEINETMRSLSLAGLSLTRLIAMHDQHISSPLPRDLAVNEHTNILKVVEYYKKKLAPIVDLSDIDTSFFEEK